MDIGSFQNLVRTVEYKADRHEILQHNLSMQQQQQDKNSEQQSIERIELERLYSALKLSSEETDARLSVHETKLSELRNSLESSLDKLATQLNLKLQQKTEFSDLETIAHKMHAKVDFEKVQDLFGELRTETIAQIAGVKKELKKKTMKKKGEAEVSVREQEFANEKLFQEIRGFKDKLTKLAN